MAYPEFSAALSASAHPLAKPGYGKQSAPGQRPRGTADFAHLRTREAAVAAYIDRMPDGAAIGYKALAASLADYGQQACGKALTFLSDAGHLRRVKEHLQLDDHTFRWVTHTYFSRTAREDAWWHRLVDDLRGIDLTERERRARAAEEEAAREAAADVVAGGAVETAGAPDAVGGGAEPAGEAPVPQEPAGQGPFVGDPAGGGPDAAPAEADPTGNAGPGEPAPAAVATAPAPAAPTTVPVPAPAPSAAYRVLQRLGRTEPRMTLSAAECDALEPLAAEWLARGATPDHLTRSLTGGLPHPMHSPGAIARTRLEKKMPPVPVEDPAHVRFAVMVCLTCDVPDNVSPLIRGVCVDCREEMAAYEAAEEAGALLDTVPDTFRRIPAHVDVARRADEARAAAGLRARPVPRPTQGTLTAPAAAGSTVGEDG